MEGVDQTNRSSDCGASVDGSAGLVLAEFGSGDDYAGWSECIDWCVGMDWLEFAPCLWIERPQAMVVGNARCCADAPDGVAYRFGDTGAFLLADRVVSNGRGWPVEGTVSTFLSGCVSGHFGCDDSGAGGVAELDTECGWA